jgi:hypothetical protein
MYKKLITAWDFESRLKKPSYFRALLRAYGWKMVWFCSGFGFDVFL